MENFEEIEREEQEEENPGANEVNAALAGIGTYGSLKIYNSLVRWLLSFVVDLGPAGIIIRDVMLSASNAAIGEMLGMRIMKGQHVPMAIRIGYVTASIHTLGAGILDVMRIKAEQSAALQAAAAQQQQQVTSGQPDAKALGGARDVNGIRAISFSGGGKKEQQQLPPSSTTAQEKKKGLNTFSGYKKVNNIKKMGGFQ